MCGVCLHHAVKNLVYLYMYMYMYIHMYMYMYVLRQLIFLRKSDCLGCAVLLCLVVCLTLLASFFLPSHLSLRHVHVPIAISLPC